MQLLGERVYVKTHLKPSIDTLRATTILYLLKGPGRGYFFRRLWRGSSSRKTLISLAIGWVGLVCRLSLGGLKKSCQAVLDLLRDSAFIALNANKASKELREALEEFADAAVNEWLRRDVVEGPPPDAYAMLLAALARSRRLVIDDSEVEKMAGEVEHVGEGEEGEA